MNANEVIANLRSRRWATRKGEYYRHPTTT